MNAGRSNQLTVNGPGNGRDQFNKRLELIKGKQYNAIVSGRKKEVLDRGEGIYRLLQGFPCRLKIVCHLSYWLVVSDLDRYGSFELFLR